MKKATFLSLIVAFLCCGCIPTENIKIKEKLAIGDVAQWSKGDHKIAVIPVVGVLMMPQKTEDTASLSPKPVNIVEQTTHFLRKAAHDQDVKATVLIVDSPGGGITESELIREEVIAYKRTGKPLVVWHRRVAASGGYYISADADHIVSHPMSITGSIGVITMLPDLSGLMAKLGIQANTIKSGKMKDAGSPIRPMTTEENAYFQQIIDSMYDQFLNVIVHGRKQFTKETLKPLADGRVFTAQQALDHGLVDSLGTFQDALKQAARLAELDPRRTVKAVEYKMVNKALVISLKYADVSTPGLDFSLRFPESPSPGLWYLWQPSY